MIKEETVDIIETLKSKKQKVAYILKNYPEARNNDNYLCMMYWKIFDKAEKLDDIIFATKPEVIRRARQKLQNEDLLYLPTNPDIIKARRIAEKAIRSGISRV